MKRSSLSKEKSHSKIWMISVNSKLNLFDDLKCKEVGDRSKEQPVIRKQSDAMLNLLKSENITISTRNVLVYTKKFK